VFREVLETTSGMTAGINFEIAYSPERIDPGNKTFGISNTPKLVGGLSGRATERAVNLYSRFIDTVIPASSAKAAESAKLLENTFRHVNIAFVNEFAMACNALGVDVFEVIDLAASKPFGFQRFVPGAGAGGHCIPVDPNYLVHSLRLIGDENYTSILFSNEVNERVASYLCNQVAEFLNQNAQPDSTSRVVAVLGLTYKPDTQDDRESPAERIIPGLESIASEILVHDPHITSRDYWHGYKMIREERFEECLERADCILVLQPHSKYLEQAAFLNKFESKSILAFRGVELEARHAYEPTI
jgi:nucleotide sugar dehydrogenase